MVKITYKGETREVPKRYLPDSLTATERKKQIKSIFEGTDRPETKQKKRRSTYTIKFDKNYGDKLEKMKGGKSVRNIAKVTGLPYRALKDVFERGEKAYDPGSRPGVQRQQWAYGRLFGYIENNPKVRKADADITKKYNVKF